MPSAQGGEFLKFQDVPQDPTNSIEPLKTIPLWPLSHAMILPSGNLQEFAMENFASRNRGLAQLDSMVDLSKANCQSLPEHNSSEIPLNTMKNHH